MTDLAQVISDSDVLLCCGTGGVGKTTAAAALGMAAAQAGRRAVVVTIDPARRLADALGLDGIGNDCVRVQEVGPGELWVTMLDTKATFDQLIERHANDADQARRILDNRYYKNLSTGLSGTREFMAMERLYELHQDDRFDLVVVDTPPSRSALDFLEAPDRLARFLEGRLFRIAAPTRQATRMVTGPLLVLLRRIAGVISPEVVDDTLAFIEAFSGMEDGFKERADAVDSLLASENTAFVLVATPQTEAVDESRFFVEKLAEAGLPVRALIINRLQPRFTERSVGDLTAVAGLSPDAMVQLTMLRKLAMLADAEDAELEPLLKDCGAVAVARVEQLDHDVHDMAGIAEIAACLFDPQS